MRIDAAQEVSLTSRRFEANIPPLHACLTPDKHVTVAEERVDIVRRTVASCYRQEIPAEFTSYPSTPRTLGVHTHGGGVQGRGAVAAFQYAAHLTWSPHGFEEQLRDHEGFKSLSV